MAATGCVSETFALGGDVGQPEWGQPPKTKVITIDKRRRFLETDKNTSLDQAVSAIGIYHNCANNHLPIIPER